MFIDADVHISPYPRDGGITPEQVIRAMDRAGIDKAVCWLQPPYMRTLDDAMAYVDAAARRYPDRLLPFGWIDPHFDEKTCMDMCKRCLDDYGCYGIKFNGAQNDFSLEKEELLDKVIEKIAAAKKLVGFHIGDESNNTHPLKAAKLTDRWPDVNFLMIHMGGAACNMEDACIEVAAKHKNMYLVGSSVDYPYVLKAIRTLGAERVLFGSDMPFNVMEADAAGYRAFLSAYCTEEESRLVMGENAARLLNLKEGING